MSSSADSSADRLRLSCHKVEKENENREDRQPAASFHQSVSKRKRLDGCDAYGDEGEVAGLLTYVSGEDGAVQPGEDTRGAVLQVPDRLAAWHQVRRPQPARCHTNT